MAKQLIFRDEARYHLKAGLDKTARAVAATFGPKGHNVVLNQGWGTPIITHNGLTIAKEIELENRYENMGAQLLRQVAAKTNELVGDGTTTAVLIAQALVNEGLRNVSAGANAMLLRRGIDKAIVAVLAAIKSQSIQICSQAELANVAAIAAQDREIGELIAKVLAKVGLSGAVTIGESHGLYTETEYVEGIQFDQGYLSSFFITHAESMEAILEEPYLLLCDQKISAASELVPLLEKLSRLSHRNLLVIADDILGEALTTLVLNKLRATLNLVAVKSPGLGEQRQAMLHDIAVLTGGTVISQMAGRRLESATLADLGSCDRLVVTKDKTTIIGGHGHETALKERINQIKSEIEQAGTYKKQRHQERLSRLTGAVAIIKVGGATNVELKEKKQRVENALNATQAVVEEGVVPGGGVALLNAACALEAFACQNAEEATATAIIRRALEEPMRTLVSNAGMESAVIVANVRRRQQLEDNHRIGYNVMSEQYEDMIVTGIIDPAKVTRSAVQSAASIASLILTTDALVADVPNRQTAISALKA